MSASEVCHPPPPAFSDEPPLVASPSQHSRQPRQPRLVEAGGRRARLEVAGDDEHNKEEKEDEGDVRRRCSGVRREANSAPASGRAEDSEALASHSDAESPDRRFVDDRRRVVDAVLHSSAAQVVAAPTAGVILQKHGDGRAKQQLGVLPTPLAALAGATVPAPGADSTGDRIADAAATDSVAGFPSQTRRLAGCGQFHRSGGSSYSSSSNCFYCAVDDAVALVVAPSADFVAATTPLCGCEQHERSDHHYARAALASAPVTASERPMSAIVEETLTCVDEGFDDEDSAAVAAAENDCSDDEDVEEETEDDSSSGSLRRRRRRKSSTSDLEKLKRLTARLGLNARRPSYTAWQQQLVAAAADAAPPTAPFSPASFSAAAIAANFAAAAGRPRRANATAAGAAEASLAAWNSAATLGMGGDSGGGVVADACNRYDGDGGREGGGRDDIAADITAASHFVRPAVDTAAAAAAAGTNAATDIRTTIARVDQLLRSLKTELIKMQETDQTLAKQFIALRQDVQQLRLQQARLRYEDLIDEAAAQLEAAAAVAGGRPGYEELLSDDGMLPPAPPSLLRGRLDSSTSSGIGGCSCDPDTADALAQLASIGITKMNLLERRFSVF